MSGFGFEVVAPSGQTTLDDKSFTIVGNPINLPAGTTFVPVGEDFNFIGVKGDELRKGSIEWWYRGSSVEVSLNTPMLVYFFGSRANYAEEGSYGLQVINESGDITFDSRNLHVRVDAQWSFTPLALGGVHSLPIDFNKFYIHHSVVQYVSGTIQEDYQYLSWHAMRGNATQVQIFPAGNHLEPYQDYYDQPYRPYASSLITLSVT